MTKWDTIQFDVADQYVYLLEEEIEEKIDEEEDLTEEEIEFLLAEMANI